MENVINKAVTVTALSFSNKGGFKSVPKRIEYDNHVVTFLDNGMQYLVRKGQHLVRLLDLTDGQDTYRLKGDADDWTLIRIQRTVGA